MKISFSFAVIVGFPNYFVKFVMLIFIYNNVFSFICFDLQAKIFSKMYLIENKEVTLLCKLNR